ncbi:MAG: DUF5719 family protein, partial [Acidimicrobiales bacterium]
SAWFCAGATAASDGAANGTVAIANAGKRTLTGSVTVIPTEGDTKAVIVSVPASGQATVRLTDVLAAPYASAVVELDGGEAVVELSGTGTLGDTITPCASNAATSWYFAEGVTTKDATEVISLFNPFPEDAVVDMVFTTEEGQVTPQALTGLSVRGRGLTAVNLGDHVQRRESVATRITVRAGRLVASRLQTFDGTGSRKGMALTLGAASPGDVWYFPQGFIAEGLNERFQVFNPALDEALVSVELSLEQGQAEPIELTIAPEARVTLSANDEARIPKSVAHGAVVRSTNGVAVVVERTTDATSPSARAGVAITLGARVPALRSMVAAGLTDDSTDEWLVVQNPGNRPARVTVTLLDNGTPVTPPAMSNVNLPAHQQLTLHLNDLVRRGPTPLLITADERVVAERDQYRTRIGMAMSMAIPLR